jgi:hypothetical protein
VRGTWEHNGHRAVLTVGGARYEGVFLRQWNPESASYVMTFSALSEQGVAIWGSRLAGRTDRQIMVWSGTAWYDARTGLQIPAGEWSHLTFTGQDGALTVYVNGVQKFSGDSSLDNHGHCALALEPVDDLEDRLAVMHGPSRLAPPCLLVIRFHQPLSRSVPN